MGVLTPSVGTLGTLLWPILQRRLRLTSLHVLILLTIAASIILLYSVTGLFAPRGARWGLCVPDCQWRYSLAVYFDVVRCVPELRAHIIRGDHSL